MTALKPKAMLPDCPGNVITYDLQFVEGEKAAQTLIFEMCEGEPPAGKPHTKESWTVYLDISKEKLPVAISFVHHKDAPLKYVTSKDNAEAMAVVEKLYEFSKQLIQMRITAEKVIKAHALARRAQIRKAIVEPENEISRQMAENLLRLEHHKSDGQLAFA